MQKRVSKELKIGISFIICIFILYFGISFLKGLNIFRPTNSYVVVFRDVTDLNTSSPVVLNGYKVGLVHSMEMDEDNPQRILTIINLNKGVKVPKGSELYIEASMLGSASIIIKPNNDGTTAYYAPSDTIIGIHKPGKIESLYENLVPQVTALLPRIDTILTGLQKAVTSPALNRSIDNIGDATGQLKTAMANLNVLLAAINRDVPEITQNMNAISNDMAKVTAQAKSIDFTATYNTLDSTLKNIQILSDKINSTDNSIGLLLNDRQLHDSLTTTLNNASLLLQDIKKNPSRYINVKIF
ncbi:MAG: MlaD family protein [Prevotella sp.]|jgi:phospholipid/cholesterol/gamma-HCH transport system substrate-binding protein|nr:MlaD family protein [Prevotella sp.]